jgi:hypothetical protein
VKVTLLVLGELGLAAGFPLQLPREELLQEELPRGMEEEEEDYPQLQRGELPQAAAEEVGSLQLLYRPRFELVSGGDVSQGVGYRQEEEP